jgi:hypothetical protein
MTTPGTDLTPLADEFRGDPALVMPGFVVVFIAFALLVVVLGIASVAWRIHAARSMARRAGLDEGEAVRMALASEDGLTATYLASSLRGSGPSAPVVRDPATRLRELDRLRAEGLITEDEHAARRVGIIGEV